MDRLAGFVLGVRRDDVEPVEGHAGEAARRQRGAGGIVVGQQLRDVEAVEMQRAGPDRDRAAVVGSRRLERGEIERLDPAGVDMTGGQAGQVDLRAVLAEDVDRGNGDLVGFELLRQRAIVVRRRVGRQQFDDLVLGEIGVGELDVSDGERIAVEGFEREIVDRDVVRGRRRGAGAERGEQRDARG